MIGIVLVNYNGWKDTIECIQSLNRINNRKIKIIVVDNNSSDDSLKHLKPAADKYKFELIASKQNNGFSAGNNLGIKYCFEQNFDYIILLNNDTIVSDDFLDKLIEEADKNNIGIAAPKILYCSEPNKIWYAGGSISKHTCRSQHHKFNLNNDNDKETKEVSFASGCCMCIKTERMKKIGMLDEDFFLYEEDAEYCLRAIDKGYKIVYVPQSVIYHKVSSSTGKSSAITQYYSVRNKYLLIKKSIKGFNKTISFLFCTIQFLYRCLKKELDFKYYKEGLKAFKKGEIGKRKEKL